MDATDGIMSAAPPVCSMGLVAAGYLLVAALSSSSSCSSSSFCPEFTLVVVVGTGAFEDNRSFRDHA